MKKLSVLFGAFALVCFQLTAQSSKTFNVEDFSAISINNSANVIFSTGPTAVSASGSQDLIDNLEIVVKKGSLSISDKKGKSGNWSGKKGVTIKVSSPELKALVISGSGDFWAEGDLDSKTFAITISGSGDVVCKNNITCDEFTLVISGSGDVNLNGSSRKLAVACSGSGDVDMKNFSSKEAHIVNSGSADIEISVSEKISVVNSGSGDIQVKGSPEKKSIVNTGSGDIDYR